MKKQTATAVVTGLSLSRYYNASHLSADTWQRLRDTISWLAESQRTIGNMKHCVTEALDLLEPIAIYWAFIRQHSLPH